MANEGVAVQINDVSGQKSVDVETPGDVTVGELVNSVLANEKMKLPLRDSEGAEIAYTPHLQREGRNLGEWETVGEALEPGDQIVLQPDIVAGATRD